MTKTPPPLPPARSASKRVFKVLLGLLILAAGVAVSVIAHKTKPDVKATGAEKKVPIVKVARARKGTETMSLPSQGLIEPKKRTTVAAEVGGKVEWVSPKFKVGGEFEEGDELARIDPTDYDAAVVRAIAAQAEAELALETERANAKVAEDDWKRLGRTEQASDFTLRKPHVAKAEKQVASAGEEVERAKRDRERTRIVAPFKGRLEAIHTELGAYLVPGAAVADIYTTAPYEIRLPLSLDDWTLLKRDEEGEPAGKVDLRVTAGGEDHAWSGKVVRAEGLVERESRSIYVVAEIGGNVESNPIDASLIQPGLFVKADIHGKTMEDVIRIPVEAFRNLEQVMVVDQKPDSEEYTVFFRKVKVLRRSSDEVLVKAGRYGESDEHGIEVGEMLCLTELSDLIGGTTVVRPQEEVPETDQSLTGEPKVKP